MADIRGFITNLGKYNEGDLVGEWIEFPIDEDELEEVFERIGISDEPDEDGNIYEEYFFTDWELPDGMNLGEYESIDDVNEMAEQIDDFDDDMMRVFNVAMDEGYDFDNAVSIVENRDYIIWHDCDDMGDVAEQYIDECGILEQIPESYRNYFDYEKYGRDMELEGEFVQDGNDYIQIMG